MGSKYNYVFSNQAKKDFNDIVYYVSAQLSHGDTAKKFIDKIVDEIQTICIFPKKAPIFENSFLPKLDIKK